MPIRGKATDAGIFNTSELALLGRVFDRLKVEGQAPGDGDAVASRIIANYMAGIKDEDELLALSRQALGR
ncbi:hypothetical protein LB556_22150 [Mesorhizobium sp. ES1-4]|nr:hypothetical protein [Mesorhizobium sp. ES1-4]